MAGQGTAPVRGPQLRYQSYSSSVPSLLITDTATPQARVLPKPKATVSSLSPPFPMTDNGV